MRDPFPIDAFGRHELLHGIAMVHAQFDEFVDGHRYTVSDPELARIAADIGDRLGAFYQLVGSKILSIEPEESPDQAPAASSRAS